MLGEEVNLNVEPSRSGTVLTQQQRRLGYLTAAKPVIDMTHLSS